MVISLTRVFSFCRRWANTTKKKKNLCYIANFCSIHHNSMVIWADSTVSASQGFVRNLSGKDSLRIIWNWTYILRFIWIIRAFFRLFFKDSWKFWEHLLEFKRICWYFHTSIKVSSNLQDARFVHSSTSDTASERTR